MRFQIGDRVATKYTAGIFERGQLGIVSDCLDGEILFESGDGQLQWLPEERVELVTQEEYSEEGPSVLRIIAVAIGVMLLAVALIGCFTLIATYFGIGC